MNTVLAGSLDDDAWDDLLNFIEEKRRLEKGKYKWPTRDAESIARLAARRPGV